MPNGNLADRIGFLSDDELETNFIGADETFNPLEAGGFVYNGMRWPGAFPVVVYKVNALGDFNTHVQIAGNTWSNSGANFALNYEGHIPARVVMPETIIMRSCGITLVLVLH